jgi:hypothetical protein
MPMQEAATQLIVTIGENVRLDGHFFSGYALYWKTSGVDLGANMFNDNPLAPFRRPQWFFPSNDCGSTYN